MAVGVARRAHDLLQLHAPAPAHPARQQLALGLVARLALLRVALVPKLVRPLRDRVVVGVADRGTHTADVHDALPSRALAPRSRPPSAATLGRLWAASAPSSRCYPHLIVRLAPDEAAAAGVTRR